MFYAAPCYAVVRVRAQLRRQNPEIDRARAMGYCAGHDLDLRIQNQIKKGDYRDWRWMREYLAANVGC